MTIDSATTRETNKQTLRRAISGITALTPTPYELNFMTRRTSLFRGNRLCLTVTVTASFNCYRSCS